jgi:hypothetical protein
MRAGSRVPTAARSHRALVVMQAIMGFEVDIGISAIHLHSSVVWFWISFVRLMGFLGATSKNSTTRIKIFHILHWQNRCSVMLGVRTMDLVNWDRGVDDFWLNGLLVNDGLNVLVNY